MSRPYKSNRRVQFLPATIAEEEEMAKKRAVEVAEASETQKEQVLIKQITTLKQQVTALKNKVSKLENEAVDIAATNTAHNAVSNALVFDLDMGRGTKKNKKHTKKHKKKRGKKTHRYRSKRYKR
jgi:uncharacterized protein YlxW (UPF0749 family)